MLAEPSEADQTQSTVFYPLDRDKPVVVKGTSGGLGGDYDFIAQGAAAVAALGALADYEGLVYVESGLRRRQVGVDRRRDLEAPGHLCGAAAAPVR